MNITLCNRERERILKEVEENLKKFECSRAKVSFKKEEHMNLFSGPKYRKKAIIEIIIEEK